MTRSRLTVRFWRMLVWTLVLWLGAMPAMARDAVVADPEFAATRLAHLAEAGRFDEVLHRLRTDFASLGSERVTSLTAALERYRRHQEEHARQREKAYREALDKAKVELDTGDIEDALVASIDAHSLASDPDALLQHATIRKVVQTATSRAKEAEARHDWVEALSLYRALELLYENREAFRNDVRRAARHLHVLQLYAPDQLQQLYDARAARRAERGDEDEDENPVVVEREPWQNRLHDIELSMLRQTLHQAQRDHVSADGYTPLMRGAVDALLVLLQSEGLAQTFDGFRDAEALEEFRDYVSRISAMLKAPGKRLNFVETGMIIDRIMAKNADTVRLPEEVIVFEMTEGATDTLDDFSAVIWPEEVDQFNRSTQGKFYGVGVQISRRDGRLIVVSPLANTPAQEAGIKAEDIIATVDGRDTSNWTLDRAVREITGPEGTLVRLGIERVGEPEMLHFDIRRAEIVIESIRGWEQAGDGEWSYWIDPEHRIGYVRLSQFIPQTAEDLDRAIAQMQADGPINGLILDLRFNPGGLLSSAVDIADRFVEQGPIVFTVNDQGAHTNETRAHRRVTYRDFPVVVLINQGSASASEIVSGALQDYSRALVIGTRTFGKGSVQDLFPLDRGRAYLKLTTQYYMLPLGRIIHRKPGAKTWGIDPDLEVKVTDDVVRDAIEFRQEVDVLRDAEDKGNGEPAKRAQDILDTGLDPQLEAALLVLQTRLVAKDIAVALADPKSTAQRP